MMERIIKAHYPDLEQKLIDGVLEAFYKIRDIRGLQKLSLIHIYNIPQAGPA